MAASASALPRKYSHRSDKSQDAKWVAVEGAEGEGDAGGGLGEAVAEALEGGAFAVAVEGGDDGDAGLGGGEGVVVGDFAGEVELGLLGDGVLEVFAACRRRGRRLSG